MKNTLRKLGLLSLIFVLIATVNTGCRRKKDTLVEVTVKNSAGVVVPGALVQLYPEPTACLNCPQGALLWDFETETNSAGVAVFNFNEIYQLGQAGVAVGNIKALYSGSTGTGVVKIEQETTSTATVFI